MNSSGVDKLVNDNIEQYDKFRNSLVTSVYTDENTDSVFIYSKLGKEIVYCSKRARSLSSLLPPTSLFAHQPVVFEKQRLYMTDGNSLFLMSPNERTENIRVFKDTSQPFLGNIYLDPCQNLCGRDHPILRC